MVKKNRAAKQQAVPAVGLKTIEMTGVPPGGLRIPDRHTLEEVRERVGLSQRALAKESGISRDLIANYETGRTSKDFGRRGLDLEQGLKIWRVLEVKERGLASGSLKKYSAANSAAKYSAFDYLFGLLWLAKEVARKKLSEIDAQIANLQRKRDSATRQAGEIESEYQAIKKDREEYLLRGLPTELSGKLSELG